MSVEPQSDASQIPVLGYARISDEDDDDETSLDGQEEDIENYCKEHDYKLVKCFKDRNVSGATDPLNRDGFSKLFQTLQEDERIGMVLIRKGDRVWRGEPVSRVERDLELKLDRRVDFLKVKPTGIEESIQDLKNSDNPTQQQMGKMMENSLSDTEGMKVAKAKEDGKRFIAEKRAADQPFHRPPRGITTDKQKFEDQNRATDWAPVDDADEDYNEFDTCIEMLNEMATTEMSPYQVGKEFDVPNPDRKMKNLWDNRDVYRAVAQAHRPQLGVNF